MVHRRTFAGIALALASFFSRGAAAQAQEPPPEGGWVMVDEHRLWPSQPSASFSMLADDRWGVIAGGIATDGLGRVHWLLRRSEDGGETWVTMDDAVDERFSGPASHYRPLALAASPDGALYAAGYSPEVHEGDPFTVWTVRGSRDGGLTWESLDRLDWLGEAMTSRATAVVAAAGDVFVAGSILNPVNGLMAWVVRRSRDGGETWQFVDELQLENQKGYVGDTHAHALLTVPPSTVFCAGSVDFGPWIVRRSTDGGDSWTTVDILQGLDPGGEEGGPLGASPRALAVDAAGGLHAGGVRGVRPDELRQWHGIVRKSTDGGDTWSTIHDDPECTVTSILTDAAGKVHITSFCPDRPGPVVEEWGPGFEEIRASADGGGAWSVIGSLETPGFPNQGRAVDSSGNWYISGRRRATDGLMSWAVFKLSATPGPFLRGDCDGDGVVDGRVTDAVFLLKHNFLQGPAPPCLAACDADGDGVVAGRVTDAVYLLSRNFLGGPPPLPPFPGCGAGVSSDASLGCEVVSEGCQR